MFKARGGAVLGKPGVDSQGFDAHAGVLLGKDWVPFVRACGGKGTPVWGGGGGQVGYLGEMEVGVKHGGFGYSSPPPGSPARVRPEPSPEGYFLALFFTSGSCLFTMPVNGVVKRMRRSNMNDQFSM